MQSPPGYNGSRGQPLTAAPVCEQAGLKLLLARTHWAGAPAPLGCPRTFELIFTVLRNTDMRLPGLHGLP